MEVDQVRIKLLIATVDTDYSDHLSDRISQHYTDLFDVSVCRSQERFNELVSNQRIDIALCDIDFIKCIDIQSIHLPLIMTADDEDDAAAFIEYKRIGKYQRISDMVSRLLELYARVPSGMRSAGPEKANITAVWSPTGGVGKTTVALAYAAKKALDGKQVLYLNLESFSSVPIYFPENGKSISTVFEMLEEGDGNVKMLIRSILKQDSGGIAFFCRPENFDDMNILSVENISSLIEACAGVTDELIIDMSCACDERTRQLFVFADRVFLVTDPSGTANVKLSQFVSQNNVFELIKAKTTIIANKGAFVSEPDIEAIVALPFVQSSDESAIFKVLSRNSFEG